MQILPLSRAFVSNANSISLLSFRSLLFDNQRLPACRLQRENDSLPRFCPSAFRDESLSPFECVSQANAQHFLRSAGEVSPWTGLACLIARMVRMMTRKVRVLITSDYFLIISDSLGPIVKKRDASAEQAPVSIRAAQEMRSRGLRSSRFLIASSEGGASNVRAVRRLSFVRSLKEENWNPNGFCY